MVEILRVLDGFPQTLAILDVAGVVADPGVEDVVKCVLAEKEVADDAQTLAVGLRSPQSAQVGNRVYRFLLVPHRVFEVVVGQLVLLQQRPHLLLVLLHERYDALPEVLRDVLRFVLEPPLLLPLLLRRLRLLGPERLLRKRLRDRNIKQMMRVLNEGAMMLFLTMVVLVLCAFLKGGRIGLLSTSVVLVKVEVTNKFRME